jgi:hypothetical protein
MSRWKVHPLTVQILATNLRGGAISLLEVLQARMILQSLGDWPYLE